MSEKTPRDTRDEVGFDEIATALMLLDRNDRTGPLEALQRIRAARAKAETNAHAWICYDGSWHCYPCGVTLHCAESDLPKDGCLPFGERVTTVLANPTRWSRQHICEMLREADEKLKALALLRAPETQERKERALCSTCHGNGVVKIPGGVSVCDTCNGDCWAKPETQERGWQFDNPDDETLPITRCICGEKFGHWQMTISIYADDPTTMPCCARRVYFTQRIEVVEVPSPPTQTEDR